MSYAGTVRCPLSPCNFLATTIGLWLSHVRVVHKEDPSFVLECCETTYTKCASFVTHVYRRHRDVLGPKSVRASDSFDASTSNSISQADSISTIYIEPSLLQCNGEGDNLSQSVHQLLSTDEHEQKKKSAMFLLQLKEKRCLSQVAIDDIVLASKDLFQHSVGRVRAAVHECISRADIDPSDIPGLNEVYSKLKDPFKDLHSTYLQEKCFTESFGCIVSLFVVVIVMIIITIINVIII